jgi:hypothetical protein
MDRAFAFFAANHLLQQYFGIIGAQKMSLFPHYSALWGPKIFIKPFKISIL